MTLEEEYDIIYSIADRLVDEVNKRFISSIPRHLYYVSSRGFMIKYQIKNVVLPLKHIISKRMLYIMNVDKATEDKVFAWGIKNALQWIINPSVPEADDIEVFCIKENDFSNSIIRLHTLYDLKKAKRVQKKIREAESRAVRKMYPISGRLYLSQKKDSNGY